MARHRTACPGRSLIVRVCPRPLDVRMDPVVHDALRAVERHDWDALRGLLHPYLHWTRGDGRRVRGRTNALAELVRAPVTGPPLHYELRDGQIYRWVEAPPVE